MPTHPTFRIEPFLRTALNGIAAGLVLLAVLLVLPRFAEALQHITGSRTQVSPGDSAASALPVLERVRDPGASRNWSGYSAKGTFSAVGAEWRVPAISSSNTAFASDATWVGIGGVESGDLIQAGTHALLADGEIAYKAWYELLPGAMRYTPLVVNPGDILAASVTELQPGIWSIYMHNKSTGKTFQKTVRYQSTRLYANWVEERPSLQNGTLLPLPNFEKISFRNAYAVRSDGEKVDLAGAGARPITMLSYGGMPLAEPTAIGSDGRSFSVTRSQISSERSIPKRGALRETRVVPIPANQAYTVTEQSSAQVAHGAYYYWVNGQLVDKKEW